MGKVEKTFLVFMLLYFAVANYCNFKEALGLPTTYCHQCK